MSKFVSVPYDPRKVFAVDMTDKDEDEDDGFCGCGSPTGRHKREDPGCEYHDHHCESCHEKGICTTEACGFASKANT